ncbi:GDP-mannose 4,6-dehydratase [Patescibacteria group bacterium]|nr:GDP-mannose 4,6-dehydratase [Patescibacteria group bacterium]MBU1890850.1 GDP-mannose 4,6-dehydratase [Patescibacteria group bacterium]
MSVADLVQKKNILITGGAGFIGSHLCDVLVKEGNVICLDNFISSDISNIQHLLQLPNFEFIKHDIIEPVDLEALPGLKKFKIPFHGIHEIYHLACPTSHYEKHEHQVATILTSGLGTKNILDLAVKYRSRLLFTSSSAVYGWPSDKEGKVYKEGDLGVVDHLGERSCYDEGKRYSETLLKIYRDQHDIDARTMRLFQTYGPRMSLADNRMIPRLINKAVTGEKMVVYAQPDDQTSICYISDIIEAIDRMMKSNLVGPINIGNPSPVRLSEIAEKIKKESGTRSEISYEEESPYTHHRGVPDINLAKSKLGWFPVIPLDEGLKMTIDDMRGSRVIGFEDIKI